MFVPSIGHVLRALRVRPGFAVMAILTLALGIGANTAIFSVVYTVLIQPLPWPNSDRIVGLSEESSTQRAARTGYQTFLDWRRDSRVIAYAAAMHGWYPALSGNGEATYVNGLRTSYEFFDVLGAPVLYGRGFLPQDDRRGAAQVVVITESFWRRRFNADARAIGRTVLLDAKPYEIIGVLPDAFRPDGSDIFNDLEIWAPLGYDATLTYACRDCRHLQVLARLRPGISPAKAHAELSTLQTALDRTYPAAYASDVRVSVVPIRERLTGSAARVLWVLLAGVGLLVLLACANVSNLFLVRATERSNEIATRIALGATRRHILLDLLAESVTVSLLGGIAGVLLASWAMPLIVKLAPADLPHLTDASISAPVLAFAFLISVGAGVLSGLAPAFDSSHADLQTALKDAGRHSDRRSHRTMRDILVASEVALAFVLAIGAGLLMKSFLRLMEVNPGFEPANALTVSLEASPDRQASNAAVDEFFRQALDRVHSLRGVQAAGAVNILPLGGSFDRSVFCIEGRPGCDGPTAPDVDRFVATPGYFRAMRIPIIEGRDFTDQDRADTQRVVIVGKALARLFPDGRALGRRIKVDDSGNWTMVVGVVGDVRMYGLDVAPEYQVYQPHAQRHTTFMAIVARAAGAPAALALPIQQQIRFIERNQPIFRIATLDQVVGTTLVQRRFALRICGVFAVLALILAASGIYSVLSYAMSRRTQEIGIRMALGATGHAVVRLILSQALTRILMGIAAGSVFALALSRLLRTMLFAVSPTDPAVFLGVAALLTAVALFASYVPARRASRADPLSALRHE